MRRSLDNIKIDIKVIGWVVPCSLASG